MRRGSSGISCLLAVDKPLGLSSHDVVNRVRRILSERRVGHAGTLDPAASGVLVVGVGQATRLLGLLTLDDKRYVARIAFGTQTTTDDAEGEPLRTAEVPPQVADEAFAREAIAALVGEHDQLPPAYSAISVGGRRAYEMARSGDEVELKARRVSIYDATLLSVGHEGQSLVWDCAFHVSKGTYIRSIARDLGADLETAAHLCGLQRTSSGPIGIAQCLSLDELASAGAGHVMEHTLDPTLALGLAVHDLSDSELQNVLVGRTIACPDTVSDHGAMRPVRAQETLALVSGERLMGVWERRGAYLHSKATFPEGIGGVRS